MEQHLRRIDSLWWGKAPLERTYDLFLCNTAHGTHVPGNKTPLMCALCLAEGEKAAHAYIMGGETILRWLSFFFSFWLCDSFACWWKIDVNHSPWLLSQHPFTLHSLFFCPDLLFQPVTPLLTALISFFYPLITFYMPPFFSHCSRKKKIYLCHHKSCL